MYRLQNWIPVFVLGPVRLSKHELLPRLLEPKNTSCNAEFARFRFFLQQIYLWFAFQVCVRVDLTFVFVSCWGDNSEGRSGEKEGGRRTFGSGEKQQLQHRVEI